MLEGAGLGSYLGERLQSPLRWGSADLKGQSQDPFKLGFIPQEMLQSRLLLGQEAGWPAGEGPQGDKSQSDGGRG